MIIRDCKRNILYILYLISVQYNVQASKPDDLLLVSCRSVKKLLKLVSMIKPIQIMTSSLMYMIIVYKVDNKDTPSNFIQNDNHLPPIDDVDLRKLIY